jgi:hypothetical protein
MENGGRKPLNTGACNQIEMSRLEKGKLRDQEEDLAYYYLSV